MTALTPQERVDKLLYLDAIIEDIPTHAIDDYVKHMRETFLAKTQVIAFATDDMAATGPFGKAIAWLILGWRKDDAFHRAERLALAIRVHRRNTPTTTSED